LSKKAFKWAYCWEDLVSGGGGGVLFEGVLRFKNGLAYIWKGFASENE